MNRLSLLALLVFVFLVLSQGVTQAGQFTLGEKEQGQRMVLHCGDILVVRLPANPTTGFLWSVSCSKTEVVTQQGEARYQHSPKSDGMTGVGGVEVWRFRAYQPGHTVLAFSYARPWEKEIPPIRVIAWSAVVIR